MDVRQNSPSAQEIDALARRIDRPIVMVGMMGVGKSSVGKRLAKLLHLPFVDADDEIERSARMTIPEIFEQYGEDYFRDGERRVIARLIEESAVKPQVIATGGGAFCHTDTRTLILERALAVWLDSDVDTLVERTRRKANRPLLNEGNPRDILAKLREDRKNAYSQAPIHVISSPGPHSNTVSKVIEGIAQCL